VGVEDLNSILWTERGLLDGLQFALETEHWVLSTGQIHWLARATDQVRDAVTELRRVELLRSMATSEVARDLGLHDAPSLSDIAGRMAEPWRSMLFDQRVSLIDATSAIQALSFASMDELAGLRAAISEEGDGSDAAALGN
jgi:flagellar FlgN protein